MADLTWIAVFLSGLAGCLVARLAAAAIGFQHEKGVWIQVKRDGRSASLADIREAAKKYGGLEIYADPTWLSDMDAERIWQKATWPSADSIH